MEDRFRNLAGLLTAKGRRLVALNLIDEDHLNTCWLESKLLTNDRT